jgi:hypothetical protein
MTRIILLTPLAVSVAYLLLSPAWHNLDPLLMSLFTGHVQMALLAALLIVTLVLNWNSRIGACSRISLPALFACSLTPLAVLNAWTNAPGFPTAFGGYRYFLHWLTKYPNFGPINIEVLLGLLCVVLSSLTPAAFAIFASTGRLLPGIALAFIALELLCLVPVIIKLDIGLLLAGVSFMSPVHFMGPVLRLTGLVFMGVFAWHTYTKNAEPSHPANLTSLRR